ncbi:sulfurtransferase TusA family protein [Clostridium tyrobutyricum]|uniref:sulfurtransferase TusA family protein n=1 Tax=Clostridium tyrobutyricum TaxID=1519 RepID=UPI001C384205|nr:sulfurtransferase TusA family protein [Clostridium tyrobutyricum]MBV4418022.1 sulfurtransferase TusA family protein [Clostridium tyrobutyricum]
MIDISQENYKAIEDIGEKSKQYAEGNINPIRFKAFRVSMGFYEQRKKETYMLRTRVPGGVINLKQFQRISELGRKYADGKVRFTSRQDIQFHSINLEYAYPIMKSLIEVGIITKGTGGNTVRNIECSPLSGVSLDDVFDVTPYMKAATNYLIKDPTTMNMPRKYKIAFSNSGADTGNATISDLGFIAKIVDGKRGFELYGGGGFGGSPQVALKLKDFISDKDILYYIQGMKNLFEAEGDRTNKNKARIRFIVKRLGKEKFIERFNEEVNKLKAESKLDINVNSDEFTVNKSAEIVEKVKVSKDFENILFPQKQAGYYSVYIHPQSGNLDVDNLDKILNFIEKLGYDISIRTTNTQGFIVRDLKENDAQKLLDIIKEFTSIYNIDNSLTCVGASTCQLGLCLSQNLLVGIKDEFKSADKSVKAALPRLYISGCPNSCAQHEKGKIGLHGRAKRTQNGLVPMYSVSFGGRIGSGGAKMGDEYGDIPAKKIPEFLHKLASLKVDSGYEDFYEFMDNKNNDIKELVSKYTDIEKFIADSDIYFDFGSCESFSLKGRGPGECSSGVMDVIKLDLSNAGSSLEKYKQTKKDLALYSSAVSSARTLLVLRGVDTNKDREIFKEFEKNFVDTGYVKSSIKELFESLIDYKLGDSANISDKLPEVEYLFKKVEAMYKSLDGKLEITLPKEENLDSKSDDKEDNNEKDGYKVIDFRGVKCPINFVKVKIELSKIKSGEKRGFYLDDGDPIKNVPESVRKEGHKIISIDTNYEGYNLLVVEKK